MNPEPAHHDGQTLTVTTIARTRIFYALAAPGKPGGHAH